MTIDRSFDSFEDQLRENFLKYTRKAYRFIPKMNNPRILDIGCGSGVPTLELAALSNGYIIAMDNNPIVLKELERKSSAAGYSDMIETVEGSMADIKFPDHHFDIIWAEGSITVIGFGRGLKGWKRWIKQNGFLVIHDDLENLTLKLKQIDRCGFDLIKYFPLPDDAWWTDYYQPLEEKIREFKQKYPENPHLSKLLVRKQREIDKYKSNPNDFRSVFFIMQRS